MSSNSTFPSPTDTNSIGAATAEEVQLTSYYTDKLNDLVAKFNLQTKKLSNAYVNHKLFPSNTEYENVGIKIPIN